MGIPDDHSGIPLIGRHPGLNVDAAGHLGHLSPHLSLVHQLLCLLVLGIGDAVQTFQPLLCIGTGGAQGSSIEVSHLGAAGNAAGKGIFVHTAVEPQLDQLHGAADLSFCLGDGKCDGAWLCNAQSGLHVMIDQLCQRMHLHSPLLKNL